MSKTRLEAEPGSEHFVWPVGFTRCFRVLKEAAPAEIEDEALELTLYRFIYELSPVEWLNPDNHFFQALRSPHEVGILIQQAQEISSDEAEWLFKRYSRQRIPLYNHELDPEVHRELLMLAFKPNPPDPEAAPYVPDESLFRKNLSQLEEAHKNGGEVSIQHVWEKTMSSAERENFQHALTKIHESDAPEGWHDLSEAELNMLEALSVVAQKDLELGVTKQIAETLWYLEKMGLSGKARSGILKCLLLIEPVYRGGFRSAETSKRDQDPAAEEEKPEAAFNHFLSVIRIVLGLVNSAQVKSEFYNKTEQSYYKIFEDPATLVLLALGAATHDFVEDFVSQADKPLRKNNASLDERKPVLATANQTGKAQLEHILAEVIELFDREEDMNGNWIRGQVMRFSEKLNTFNFISAQHEERDFEWYTTEILNSGSIPLILLKFADIIANKLSRPEDRHETVNTEPKDLAYIKFIHAVVCKMGLVKVLPVRFIIDIVTHYTEWLDEKEAREFLGIWLSNLSEKDKQRWQSSVLEEMSLPTRQKVLLILGPTGMPPTPAE